MKYSLLFPKDSSNLRGKKRQSIIITTIENARDGGNTQRGATTNAWFYCDITRTQRHRCFFISKLPRRAFDRQLQIDDEAALKYYRLQKISEGSIALTPGEGGVVYGPAEVGTGQALKETIELSRLIDVVNQRFGADFRPADELFFDQEREEAVADEKLRQVARANPLEAFAFVFDKALEGLFIDRMDQNEDIFARFMNNPEFRQLVADTLRQQVYEQIRSE